MNDSQLKISGIFSEFDVDPTMCEVKDEVMEDDGNSACDPMEDPLATCSVKTECFMDETDQDDCNGYGLCDPMEDPLATCPVKTECYKDEPDQDGYNAACEPLATCIVKAECYQDEPDQIFDNLSEKLGDLLDEELSSEDSNLREEMLDSSSSEDNYSSGEVYESEDSRYLPTASKVPRLSMVLPSQPGPSMLPLATSLRPAHTDLSRCKDEPGVPVEPNPNWVRVYDGEPEFDLSSKFTVRNPGPRDCPAHHSPIDYFNLFVTEEFLILLVRETNIYALKKIEKLRRKNKLTVQSRLSSWVNVNLDEIRKYVSIMLLMGITRRTNLADYWSKDVYLQYPIIKTLMPLRRFEVLSSVLNMTSRPTLSRGEQGYDPWVKIRPFLDAINDRFVQHYIPNQNLSLDESMVGMKNRSVFIQYMPNKRYSWYGIKKFELVDAISMYVVQISMYSGKDFLENQPGPFTQKVVLDLLEKGKCLNKGYHVFTDNYYTKLPLAYELTCRNTFLTGTINKHSKGLPNTIVSSNFTVGVPVYYRQGKVLLVGYKEKPTRKPVFLISTGCEADSKPVRNSHGRVSVKPVAIQRYNKFMGGVDCKDKSFYHLSCTRTAKKYWEKLFYNLLDTCIRNAYVLYSLQSGGMGNIMTRDKFVLSLVRSLSEKEQPLQPIPSASTSFLDNTAEHSLVPTPTGGRKLCPVCYKRAYYWCPGCNCGVHKLCYHQLEHKFRPKGSVRKPKPPSNSGSGD